MANAQCCVARQVMALTQTDPSTFVANHVLRIHGKDFHYNHGQTSSSVKVLKVPARFKPEALVKLLMIVCTSQA